MSTQLRKNFEKEILVYTLQPEFRNNILKLLIAKIRFACLYGNLSCQYTAVIIAKVLYLAKILYV
jgi:hypothetical protein